MADHNELGKQGETLAKEYLSKLGYRVLAHNWRYQKAEIDLICRQAQELIIVEVKSRSSVFFEQPTDKIDLKKQKLLIHAANAYIEQNELDLDCRFDIVAILFDANGHRIEHIKDAFYPRL